MASYVSDAAGNKFTETVNEYDAYNVTANADSYSFTKQDVIYSDRALAFVPLRYTTNKQYEDTSQGNVTTSVYDMGDCRTEVNHPASGTTSFTYDALGNVLTK